MVNRKLSISTLSTLAVAMLLPLVACGDRDAGLSRAEVEEIVRAEMAAVPAPTQPEPGLTWKDVEEIVQAAIASIPEPQPGLTSVEAERIARSVVASIPPKSTPADYTRFIVENAISTYDSQGLDATLAHYNREESIDGQWYVFIIDENDLVIGHPDVQRLGLDVKGWVGTDANGYNFGPEMLSATGEGKWVSYVYRNPESGGLGIDFDHLWSSRTSGWCGTTACCSPPAGTSDADEFTKSLVATAARVFREVGLEGTIAYFASPETDFAGLAAVIAYYNSAENVEGDWFAFIADDSGTIIDHYDKALVGKSLEDVLGTGAFKVTAEGNWVTTEDVRVWVVSQDGITFGSGWHSGHDESNRRRASPGSADRGQQKKARTHGRTGGAAVSSGTDSPDSWERRDGGSWRFLLRRRAPDSLTPVKSTCPSSARDTPTLPPTPGPFGGTAVDHPRRTSNIHSNFRRALWARPTGATGASSA